MPSPTYVIVNLRFSTCTNSWRIYTGKSAITPLCDWQMSSKLNRKAGKTKKSYYSREKYMNLAGWRSGWQVIFKTKRVGGVLCRGLPCPAAPQMEPDRSTAKTATGTCLVHTESGSRLGRFFSTTIKKQNMTTINSSLHEVLNFIRARSRWCCRKRLALKIDFKFSRRSRF